MSNVTSRTEWETLKKEEKAGIRHTLRSQRATELAGALERLRADESLADDVLATLNDASLLQSRSFKQLKPYHFSRLVPQDTEGFSCARELSAAYIILQVAEATYEKMTADFMRADTAEGQAMKTWLLEGNSVDAADQNPTLQHLKHERLKLKDEQATGGQMQVLVAVWKSHRSLYMLSCDVM